MTETDVVGYPLGQVNLVVADLERSRKFYERLGWRFETMGDQALMAEVPGSLLAALHLRAFARRGMRATTGVPVAPPSSMSSCRIESPSTGSTRSSERRPQLSSGADGRVLGSALRDRG